MYWRQERPIASLVEMREKIKEKYVPCHYHTRLLEQYHAICQRSSSITDYIMRFDDGRLRCGVCESSEMIITCFKMELRPKAYTLLHHHPREDL